jgi:hypothetical protein
MIDDDALEMVVDLNSPDYQGPKSVKELKKEASDRVKALLASRESPTHDELTDDIFADLWGKALKKEEAARAKALEKEEAARAKALKKEEEAARFKAFKAKIEAMGKNTVDRINLLLASRQSPTPHDLSNPGFAYLWGKEVEKFQIKSRGRKRKHKMQRELHWRRSSNGKNTRRSRKRNGLHKGFCLIIRCSYTPV